MWSFDSWRGAGGGLWRVGRRWIAGLDRSGRIGRCVVAQGVRTARALASWAKATAVRAAAFARAVLARLSGGVGRIGRAKRIRLLATDVVLALTGFVFLEHLASAVAGGRLFDRTPYAVYAAVLVVIALADLALIVGGMLVLERARRRPDAANDEVDLPRLLRDAAASFVFMALAFSSTYRAFGVSADGVANAQCYASGDVGCACDATAFDALYVSIITATSVGYGDFSPCANARWAAALQALIGILYTGVLVGVVLLHVQPPERSKDR